MQRRFPMIDFTGIEVGMHEPKFGALMARRAVQTLVEQLRRPPAGVSAGVRVRAAERRRKPRSVKTAAGETLTRRRFVFALRPLAAENVSRRSRQADLPDAPGGLLSSRAGRRRPIRACAMPGWADFNDGDIFYGLPDLESRGFKFAHDAHGVAVRPRHPRSPADAAAIDEAARPAIALPRAGASAP